MQFELRIYRFNVIRHTAIYIQYSAGEFATGFPNYGDPIDTKKYK